KDRIVVLVQYPFQAFNVMIEVCLDAEIEDVIDLFVENGFGQAKRRYLRQHQAAALSQFVKKIDLVTQRSKVTCDSQRCGARADQSNAFAVRLERPFW